ncbi:MAG TPA: hypothetical protein VGB53_10900 [Rubricoccaceae bacterium]|jgi:hypothetical protein
MADRQDIADLVARARTALTNAKSDPDLAAALLPFGYDGKKLDEATALVDALAAAEARQDAEYGEQYEATEDADKAFEGAKAVYMRHVAISRIAFEGDTSLIGALALRGDREDDRPGLMAQARTFYTNALASAEAMEDLGALNVDKVSLEAGEAALNAAALAIAVQTEETGEAQEATVVRDAAARVLAAWLARFFKVAKVACDGQPQLRERLGLLER